MAETLATQILAILFCLSAAAAAAGTKVYSFNSQNSTSVSSLNANDGICKSVVEPLGYACQEHTVTTKDGYILSLQRMPSGLSGQAADKPPVLLQHGLIVDGVTWLMSLPDESLAFILADNGYDVWISNGRGTRFSRGHTSLDPYDSAYWDWTWDELAAYDLPATFQYVHDQTGQNLHYVGHSQGTLIALAAFSQGKLLNMLRSAVLLCPIAYLNHLTSPFARALVDLFIAEDLYWLGQHEFSLNGQVVNKLLEVICSNPGIDCSDLLTAITVIRTGTIAMYDYGNENDNMDHYGQPTPPMYNMTSIPNDLPLFLAYGGKDYLSDVKDVQVLLDNLKDHDGDKLVVQYTDEYAHADFVLGVNANQIVYDPVIAFFKIN
ncbi:triacylglycerol lipase 2 isoform X2 [Populus trichocarpa]|uniref:triacylglycerol lipase 2 isoform X2 n=1 Tax=Populus trichocarpa TaxID=3694 RepID=UPI000D188605|nr:triacylglycerol lipase 2 isoform X2 [Populus trichocarpa]|eukprot:XP_024440699.1 triacylglycerol lipase 2 isoform X2 [Populus trichocarpa]